jgi:hypothetical protein
MSETSAEPKRDLYTKNWCFTLNNYTIEDEKRIQQQKDCPGVYCVYGREVGDSGTKHLQGFISFPTRKRMSYLVKHIGQAHYSMARMISNSIQYCKKDGDFVEFGEPPPDKHQGQRNDIERFKEAVKNGLTDLKQIREEHSKFYARHEKFVIAYVRDHIPIHKVEDHPLRDWQITLNQTLKLAPDKRKIIFLVDTVGNAGKSWFFRHYEQLHPDNTQIIIPGKKLDMAYALNENNRVVFFDCPRSKQGEYIQYDFLEEVKNGNVFSGKYESRTKRFSTPHVVVAMNESPNMNLLSEDRYEVIEIRS